MLAAGCNQLPFYFRRLLFGELLHPACGSYFLFGLLTSPAFLQATNQGLEAAINVYASQALSLSAISEADFSINNTYVLFIVETSSTDIYEGINTLAKYTIAQAEAVNTRLMTIQVSIVLLWFYSYDPGSPPSLCSQQCYNHM